MADWHEMSTAEKAETYARKMADLAETVTLVRQHRAEECEGHPLCPGGEVASAIVQVPPWALVDLVVACLARMADQEGELESLRAALAQERDRRGTAEFDRNRAEEDAEAGWAAYRTARGLPCEQDEP